MTGPLVGHAFLTAVVSYAEMSGAGGGPAALAQGLSPLDGLLVPTLGAYDIAATFLLPFVAIRLIATERESGAGRLLAQTPASLGVRLAAKAGVLLLGWLVAWIPAFFGFGLWLHAGGHLDLGETVNVLLGHLLHGLLILGVAMAAAAVCQSSASAAIGTLGFTVGAWALDFMAAGREGLIARLAPPSRPRRPCAPSSTASCAWPSLWSCWYEVGRNRALLRSTTEPIVLEKIYELAGVTPPPPDSDPPYSGYPLTASPRGAAPLFYVAWPLAAGLAFFVSRGRWRSSCAQLVAPSSSSSSPD